MGKNRLNRLLSLVVLSTYFTQVAFAHLPELPARPFVLSAGVLRHVRLQSPSLPSHGRVVYLLQDIHLNEEAQKNLSAAMMMLTQESKQPLVFGIEGSVGKFDFSDYRAAADKSTLQKTADALLKDGHVGATAYTGLTIEPHLLKKFKAVGLESPASYMENVNAYRNAMQRKPALEEWIIREDSHQKKQWKKMRAGLRSYLEKREAYDTGRISLGEYGAFLNNRFPESDRSLNLESFLTAFELERKINFAEAEQQRQRALERLTPKLSRAEITTLTQKSRLFQTGEINAAGYYHSVETLLKHHGIALRSTPAFEQYLAYLFLTDNVRIETLFGELKTWETNIESTLALNDSERTMVNQARALALTRKLLSFTLTPEDWLSFKNHQSALSGLDASDLRPFLDFYDVAEKRNEAIVDNLGSPESAVILAGGFHTPGLSRLLKEKGYSTVVLSPKITRVDNTRSSDYLGAFLEEKSPLQKLFFGRKLFLALPEGIGTIKQPYLPRLRDPEFFRQELAEENIDFRIPSTTHRNQFLIFFIGASCTIFFLTMSWGGGDVAFLSASLPWFLMASPQLGSKLEDWMAAAQSGDSRVLGSLNDWITARFPDAEQQKSVVKDVSRILAAQFRSDAVTFFPDPNVPGTAYLIGWADFPIDGPHLGDVVIARLSRNDANQTYLDRLLDDLWQRHRVAAPHIQPSDRFLNITTFHVPGERTSGLRLGRVLDQLPNVHANLSARLRKESYHAGPAQYQMTPLYLQSTKTPDNILTILEEGHLFTNLLSEISDKEQQVLWEKLRLPPIQFETMTKLFFLFVLMERTDNKIRQGIAARLLSSATSAIEPPDEKAEPINWESARPIADLLENRHVSVLRKAMGAVLSSFYRDFLDWIVMKRLTVLLDDRRKETGFFEATDRLLQEEDRSAILGFLRQVGIDMNVEDFSKEDSEVLFITRLLEKMNGHPQLQQGLLAHYWESDREKVIVIHQQAFQKGYQSVWKRAAMLWSQKRNPLQMEKVERAFYEPSGRWQIVRYGTDRHIGPFNRIDLASTSETSDLYDEELNQFPDESPDKRWIVQKLSGGIIRLIDPSGSQFSHFDLPAPQGAKWVESLSFSQKGRWLAVGYSDAQECRIFDLSSLGSYRSIFGPTEAARTDNIAISGNGRWLAVVWKTKDYVLLPSRLIDLSSADLTTLDIPRPENGYTRRFTFSDDDRWLAAAYHRDEGRLVDLQSSAHHNYPIPAPAPRPEAGSRYGEIIVDNSHYAFSSDGRWLAVWYENETNGYLIDLRSPTPTRHPIKAPAGAKTMPTFSFSPNSRLFTVSYKDVPEVTLIDLSFEGRPATSITAPEGVLGVSAISYSGNSRWLLVEWKGSYEQRVIDLSQSHHPYRFILTDGKNTYSFSPDSRWISSMGQYGTLQEYDLLEHKFGMQDIDAAKIITRITWVSEVIEGVTKEQAKGFLKARAAFLKRYIKMLETLYPDIPKEWISENGPQEPEDLKGSNLWKSYVIANLQNYAPRLTDDWQRLEDKLDRRDFVDPGGHISLPRLVNALHELYTHSPEIYRHHKKQGGLWINNDFYRHHLAHYETPLSFLIAGIFVFAYGNAWLWLLGPGIFFGLHLPRYLLGAESFGDVFNFDVWILTAFKFYPALLGVQTDWGLLAVFIAVGTVLHWVLNRPSSDAIYMAEILDMAERLASEGKLPIAAMIVNNLTGEKIIAGRTPWTEGIFKGISHAEMAAAIEAAKKGWNLEQCTLYTTFESCYHCAKALLNNYKFGRLVTASLDPILPAGLGQYILGHQRESAELIQDKQSRNRMAKIYRDFIAAHKAKPQYPTTVDQYRSAADNPKETLRQMMKPEHPQDFHLFDWAAWLLLKNDATLMSVSHRIYAFNADRASVDLNDQIHKHDNLIYLVQYAYMRLPPGDKKMIVVLVGKEENGTRLAKELRDTGLVPAERIYLLPDLDAAPRPAFSELDLLKMAPPVENQRLDQVGEIVEALGKPGPQTERFERLREVKEAA